MIRSKKIRDSARGETCTMQIAGVCNHDNETTVFCHLPDEHHGIGIKASDASACYACSSCHDVIDGRVQSDEWRSHKLFYMRRAQSRTMNRLFEKGVIKIA